MSCKISVIGAGGWGTALAVMLAKKGEKVSLWVRNKDVYQEILASRVNSRYLPGISIPDEVQATMDFDKAVQAKEIIILSVPSQGIRLITREVAKRIQAKAILVSVAKGLEDKSYLRLSKVMEQELPEHFHAQIAVLSGPNHAEEVARDIPTATVIASQTIQTAELAQDLFSTPYFRPYTNDDLIGVETGGALKNVIAIGAGIIDGLELGDNTKAALITRGLAEITRMGVILGARQHTFAGLSGLGDLFVTCSSKHSRNRFVGVKLGQGEKLPDILRNMQAVAEGVNTTRVAYQLAKKYNVDMPITEEIYHVIYEGKIPRIALEALMRRKGKAEAEEFVFSNGFTN